MPARGITPTHGADRRRQASCDCCGKGNNAGDGFVLARHLDLRGYGVQVLVIGRGEQLRGDAAANFQILRKSGVAIEEIPDVEASQRLPGFLSGAAWLVDSLLGTGVQGEPRPPLDTVVEQLNASPAAKLAVDVPAGLGCDTGLISAHDPCRLHLYVRGGQAGTPQAGSRAVRRAASRLRYRDTARIREQMLAEGS